MDIGNGMTHRLSGSPFRSDPTDSMIETLRQYQVTREQAALLEFGLRRLTVLEPASAEINPVLLETEGEEICAMLAELYREIAGYESRQQPHIVGTGDGAAK